VPRSGLRTPGVRTVDPVLAESRLGLLVAERGCASIAFPARLMLWLMGAAEESRGKPQLTVDMSSAAASAGSAESVPGRNRRRLRVPDLAKLLGVVVALVTVAGGAVTVLFQLDPSLEPCIGGAAVTFTSIQVVPDYPFNRFVYDLTGELGGGGRVGGVVGAEVRYSYSAANLSGDPLVLRGTLLALARNGDIEYPPLNVLSYDAEDDLVPQRGVSGFFASRVPVLKQVTSTPDRCSQDASGLYWMFAPPFGGRRHRYRVLLEIYRGRTLQDRVGVGQTPVFES
jgi:hypothetical protein